MWPPKLYPEDPRPTPPMYEFAAPEPAQPTSGVFWNCYLCNLSVQNLAPEHFERRVYPAREGGTYVITYCNDCIKRFLKP
jgi:hypothetical protein